MFMRFAVKFRAKFLEKRRIGLAYFLKFVPSLYLSGSLLTCCSCVLLNPEFSGSPVLKEFIFS